MGIPRWGGHIAQRHTADLRSVDQAKCERIHCCRDTNLKMNTLPCHGVCFPKPTGQHFSFLLSCLWTWSAEPDIQITVKWRARRPDIEQLRGLGNLPNFFHHKVKAKRCSDHYYERRTDERHGKYHQHGHCNFSEVLGPDCCEKENISQALRENHKVCTKHPQSHARLSE